MLKSDVIRARQAVLDGYPFETKDWTEDSTTQLVVIENPDYREPDGDPNIVVTWDDFVGKTE